MKLILKTAIILTFASILGLCVFYAGLLLWGIWNDEWSGYNASVTLSDGSCNIAVIPIRGEIVEYPDVLEDGSGYVMPPSTNPDDTFALIEAAEQNPYITGILLQIDSVGGVPAASEAITNRLKRSLLPTSALIGSYGASAAYLIATGADTIIASPFSDVGSIGVSMSYLSYAKQHDTEGITYEQLVSAPYKNYGDPDKPLTVEERKLLQRDLDVLHDEFVKQVAENRNMPIEKIEALADGSSMPGSLALQAGLIDSLGDIQTARAWFAQELSLPTEEVVFCQ